ncbi:MAG: (2Fe-2S)-binding protein [Candidatus Lokiarchaeota archaeon]|nr:(2Fe-2S)-binding protein [Candidatus Lokiarchaeota archaeon]
MSKTKSETKQSAEPEKVRIYIMGSRYDVPTGLTIMKAMEYAGFKITRGAGCRAGFCGACSTVYRKAGDFRIYAALACQTPVEDGMVLTQLPFVPAPKPKYKIDDLRPSANSILRYYPEVARCLSCNACTRVCPQEINVMNYIQDCLHGKLAKAAEESFDCVQCGLCTIRCPAEIPQYHVAMLARRLHGKYNIPTPKYLEIRVKELEDGKYEEGFQELMTIDKKKLKERYTTRDFMDQKKGGGDE